MTVEKNEYVHVKTIIISGEEIYKKFAAISSESK